MINKVPAGIVAYNNYHYKKLQPYPSKGLSALSVLGDEASVTYYNNYYKMISAPDRQFTAEQGAFHKGALQKAQAQGLISATQYQTLAKMIDARTVKTITLPQPSVRVTAPADNVLSTALSGTVKATAQALDPINIITGYIASHKTFFIIAGSLVAVGALGYLFANTKGLMKALKGN